MHTVTVVTLGCSKNLVDSERVLKMLSNAGLDAVHEGDGYANIVIINTCGFIGDAKEESVNTILEYAEAKNNGKIEELYVMGCLSERYRDELQKEIHEVDRFYGKFDWTTIADDLSRKHGHPSLCYDRTITTPSHHAYLKIAEGCNRFCAFCAIPLITGRYKSRPIEEIEDEVRMLVGRGVKEFNVIAQDLSGYGQDLYGVQKLPELVDRLSRIEGVKWIRLHYAYPAQFPMEVMDVMANRPNVCAYLDIALQHISDKVLHYMGKPRAEVYERFAEEYRKMNETLGKKQYLVPYLMSSHPGSTLREAVELAEFLRDLGYMPQQVQDFYPTPSTISTCMYYTGLDPRTEKPVYVPKNPHEKAMQRALIQYQNPANYELVKEALIKAGRTDLIGFEKHCLIRPRKLSGKPKKKRPGK